jgi:AcrR family transcriptional regulator
MKGPARQSTPSRRAAPRANNRRERLLAAAAKLLQQHSFERSSMRAIAAMAGMQGGSIYYHFPSKDDLFQAVNEAAIAEVERAVRSAIDGVEDPWRRLEEAAAAHCEALFGPAKVLGATPLGFTPIEGKNRRRLVAARDRYDRLIDELVKPLPMPRGVTRTMFRLHVLGALNYAFTWYRPGGRLAPGDIGRTLVRMLQPQARS